MRNIIVAAKNLKMIKNNSSPLFSKTFWVIGAPILALIIFIAGHFIHGTIITIVSALFLIGSVLSAVHHAEIIADRIGEPFGALVLALSVTVIEVSLIVSLMIAGGPDASSLPRDTVFAAVMIILNGMMGVCIFAGGLKHGEQTFTLQGISSALTILVAISVLTLILPNYTTSIPGPFYTTTQLLFVGIVTFVLYATFVYVQSVLHKSHFVADEEEEHHTLPTKKQAWVSALFLLIALSAVVLLAESLAHVLESWIKSIGAPVSLAGVIIACVVLLPEGLSAFRAARNNQLQRSFNLSLGSAIASIGLTIPTVAIVSIFFGLPLMMGIDAQSTVLFLLSLFVIVLSLSTGKTTILQGVVLLVLFSVYLFSILFP